MNIVGGKCESNYKEVFVCAPFLNLFLNFRYLQIDSAICKVHLSGIRTHTDSLKVVEIQFKLRKNSPCLIKKYNLSSRGKSEYLMSSS